MVIFQSFYFIKYLLKAWQQAQRGQELDPAVQYLARFLSNNNQRVDWDDSIGGIIRSLQTVAADKLRLAAEHIEQRQKADATQEEETNQTSIELARTADAHCPEFLVQSGHEMIEKACQTASPELARVLRWLYFQYAYDEALKALGDLLRFTTISESDINQLQDKLEAMLAELRPNAVGIVDSCNVRDDVLGSPLGASDGNVHKHLFEEAKKSPLNQEPANQSFHKYLKPFMKSSL